MGVEEASYFIDRLTVFGLGLGAYFTQKYGYFKNADPNVSIEKQLRGKGQIKALRENPNVKGVDINDLLSKTPQEILDLLEKKIISINTVKQINKAFEGRDLGKTGKNKPKI